MIATVMSALILIQANPTTQPQAGPTHAYVNILRPRENPKIDWRVDPDINGISEVRSFRVLTWTEYTKGGWYELQTLADQTGLEITVAHLPPGTSKWNRIEHRLFAFITQNWRGKPLLTHQVTVQLIASTTTQTGLTAQCRLDENTYEKGTKVSDEQVASLNITTAEFHGEWNYTIAPRKPDT